MIKNRISFFDMAKGIGIILVVMGHLEYISIPLRLFIASFHMPMFFIISGMLMYLTKEENKAPDIFVKNKIKRIVIPYISFSILYLVIEIIYMYITNTVNWWNIVQNLYESVCLYGISVLWFLPAMFFGVLLLYFLRRKLSHIQTIFVVIVLTIIFYYLNIGLEKLNLIYGTTLFFAELHYFLAMLIRNIFALAFLAVGYYVYYFYHMLSIEKRAVMIKVMPLISVICLIVIAFISQINGPVDIHFIIFGNPIIYIFNSIVGSFSVICICRMFEPFAQLLPFRILTYYGKNSMIVMATHINSYILYCAIVFSMHVVKNITHAKNYIFCTLIMIIVFISEIFVIEIINRFFPFFAGNGFKKKA